MTWRRRAISARPYRETDTAAEPVLDVVAAQIEFESNVHHILVSSAETSCNFNTSFDTINLRRHTLVQTNHLIRCMPQGEVGRARRPVLRLPRDADRLWCSGEEPRGSLDCRRGSQAVRVLESLRL